MEFYCQTDGFWVQHVRQKWKTMSIKVAFNLILRYNNHLEDGIVEKKLDPE